MVRTVQSPDTARRRIQVRRSTFQTRVPPSWYPGTILAQDFIPNGQGAADVHCALTDTPSDGSAALSHTTRWLGSTTITQTGFGELPYGLAFTTNAASTLTVSCFDNNSVPNNTTATVQSGVLQVVQTSSNN